MEKKLISQREYSRRRGCAPSYICKLVKEGSVQLISGKIDSEAADLQIADYAAHLHDTGPKATGQPDDNSIAGHRKRQIAVVTSLKQLQLDEENGLLLRVDELKAEFANLFVTLKTVLRGLPSKVSGELLNIARTARNDREGMAAVSTLLLKEIDAALTELSCWQPKSNKKGGGTGKKIGR